VCFRKKIENLLLGLLYLSIFSSTNFARFEIFMVMKIQVMVFWIVMCVFCHITVWHHNPGNHNLKH